MLHYWLTVLLTTSFQGHNQLGFPLFLVIASRTPDQEFRLISWLILFTMWTFLTRHPRACQFLANAVVWKTYQPQGFFLVKHPITADFLLLVIHPASKPKWWRAYWTVKQSTLKARVECSECRVMCRQMFATTRTCAKSAFPCLGECVFHLSLNSISGDGDPDRATRMQ